ncbi:purple acid phosphatase 3 [Phalaenopsis equestris]|uniref:purple acid phosphatase 3 n=1 Tax=Phalaenopsis equestris TaxID=78828 RepID=UPI0009E292D1|nr:purple acid phosphatase 3 [Phalaenopsis equestris]XP_020576020.1 purple acid phosphatase 3 [Phalaenopsis equestris]
MEESCNRPRSTEEFPWRCTVLTQATLFLALYGAFSIGTPQESQNSRLRSGKVSKRESMNSYFLSVRGGFWPDHEQAQLLLKMSEIIELFKAKFVVNIGELGEDDPLMQNASLHFPIPSIPWYTTTALSGKSKKYFLKKIKLANDEVLDIIGIETGLFQDFLHLEGLKESESDLLYWLQRILSLTDSKWRIVVGFHPLMACQEIHEQKSIVFYRPLHQIFLNNGVNAYISKLGCAGQHYNSGGIAFLGNPGPMHQEQIPYSENGNFNVASGRLEGFYLHRLSPFEMESFFINLTGMVVSKSNIHQHGRRIM